MIFDWSRQALVVSLLRVRPLQRHGLRVLKNIRALDEV